MTKNNYRIAIMTQPLGHNYGGLLQAYALQTYLKKSGYEVVTIDRRKPVSRYHKSKSYVANVIRLLLGRIKAIPTDKKRNVILSDLANFRDKYVVMSPLIVDNIALKKYFEDSNFDAVIVGSDQVWRPRYSPAIANFFLDFTHDLPRKPKRIAYAASFGVDYSEYDSDLRERCKNLAQHFDMISLREVSGLALCRELFNVDGELVLDPTLLLSAKEYKALADTAKRTFKGKYILSYLLDSNDDKKRVVQKVSEKCRGTRIVSIKPENGLTDVREKDLPSCVYPSIEDWLSSFYYAEYVVTDSFHGVVFSIIFNKPFIAIGNAQRGLARFLSLLSQFGLEDRLITERGSFNKELIHRKIDWNQINKMKSELTDKSSQFLNRSISS